MRLKYLEQLKQRSVILWRTVFAARVNKRTVMPVYIDCAPAAKAAGAQQEAKSTDEAATMQAEEESTENAQQIAQFYKEKVQAEQVLQGFDAMETVLRSSAAAKYAAAQKSGAPVWTAADEGAQQQCATPAAADAWERMQHNMAATAAGENLLQKLRAAEEMTASAMQMYPAEHTTSVLPRMAVEPMQWSAYFEKDARRYDGACELM